MLTKLEYIHSKDDSLVWDGRYRMGRDLNKLGIRSEGSSHVKILYAEAELLWGLTFSPYWTVMTGAEQDFDTGPSCCWTAFVIQMLALYNFDVEATTYMGSSGRTAPDA